MYDKLVMVWDMGHIISILYIKNVCKPNNLCEFQDRTKIANVSSNEIVKGKVFKQHNTYNVKINVSS